MFVCEREVALSGRLVLAGDLLEAAGAQRQGKSRLHPWYANALVHYLNSSVAIKNKKKETGNK